MFDDILYLLFAILGLTFFFGTIPLIVAVKLGDRPRLERLLDLYTEVFAAGAAAIIGALDTFRRPQNPPSNSSSTTNITPPVDPR
jgi:hypothetical protein